MINAQKTSNDYFQNLDTIDAIAIISDDKTTNCSGGDDLTINGIDIYIIIDYIDKNNIKPNGKDAFISVQNGVPIINGRPVPKLKRSH